MGKYTNNLTGSGEIITSNMLIDLLHKKGTIRMGMLSLVVDKLNNSCQDEFAKTNFATILFGCLHCFKKGSLKEARLASHALGLLAITTGSEENAHELYRECLSTFSQALKPKTEPSKLISILDCLAIVTFISGDSSGNNSLETEGSMKIIWDFMYPESGSKVVASKLLPTVQAAAISSWSMLLTTIDNWMLNVEHWKRTIYFLVDLLDTDDVSIGLAASEALAVMDDMGYLEKLVRITNESDDISVEKERNLQGQFSCIEELKEHIVRRVKILLIKADNEEMPNKADREKLLKVFEDNCFPETTEKIRKYNFVSKKWSELLQMNFLKRVLGSGFVSHMLGNELLHRVFNFTVQELDNHLYVPEREDVVVRCVLPRIKGFGSTEINGRLIKSPNSVFSKAGTQLRNKQRAVREAELSTIDEMDD